MHARLYNFVCMWIIIRRDVYEIPRIFVHLSKTKRHVIHILKKNCIQNINVRYETYGWNNFSPSFHSFNYSNFNYINAHKNMNLQSANNVESELENFKIFKRKFSKLQKKNFKIQRNTSIFNSWDWNTTIKFSARAFNNGLIVSRWNGICTARNLLAIKKRSPP